MLSMGRLAEGTGTLAHWVLASVQLLPAAGEAAAMHLDVQTRAPLQRLRSKTNLGRIHHILPLVAGLANHVPATNRAIHAKLCRERHHDPWYLLDSVVEHCEQIAKMPSRYGCCVRDEKVTIV